MLDSEGYVHFRQRHVKNFILNVGQISAMRPSRLAQRLRQETLKLAVTEIKMPTLIKMVPQVRPVTWMGIMGLRSHAPSINRGLTRLSSATRAGTTC